MACINVYSFMDNIENISNTHEVLHFFLSEFRLSSAFNIGGLIFSPRSLP